MALKGFVVGMLKNVLLEMMDVFSPRVLAQGDEYFAQGFVLNVRLSDGLLKGRVRSADNTLEDIYIDLKSWPKMPARCSCQKQYNCAHAVAALQFLHHKSFESTPTFKPVGSEAKPMPPIVPKTALKADDLSWYSTLKKQKNDFFSYQIGMIVDGQEIDIVPLVQDFLSHEHAWLSLADDHLISLPLSNHQVVTLPLKRIKPLLQILLLQDKPQATKPLLLNRYQLLFIPEIEQAAKAIALKWQGESTWRKIFGQLKPLKKVRLPVYLQTLLRTYQQEGLDWLGFLRANGLGGILADDMGLGKTLQTLSHLVVEKKAGRLQLPSLIITPVSLLKSWFNEAQAHTPDLKLGIYYGPKRKLEALKECDVILSSYGTVGRDIKMLIPHKWYYVILDEAQMIKNHRAKITLAVHQLTAELRLCLSGTPIENHLGELWSLFHFLMPGLLGSIKQFRKNVIAPMAKNESSEFSAWLIKKIEPFVLRRTKAHVATELPPKTEIIQHISLEGRQRDLYEVIRAGMQQKVTQSIKQQGMHQSRFILLSALLRLRQVCCHPHLIPALKTHLPAYPSAKLKMLMTLLQNLIKEKRRVLVFSQFTSMLKLIEQELHAHQYSFVTLTGQTKKRQDVIETFQQNDVSIFLLSLKAGGVGLNLTQADTVIHFDPWWNPAAVMQATDRVHRLGQQNPIFVYKLIATGTIEEKMLHMQTQKQDLSEKILNARHQLPTLTSSDIDAFFAPIPE
ncbi:MAG: hypothetical protein CMF38_03625 [Legionellaceae bacterium]|nr:hypothetical protein [Legionellaceae bacterium]HAF87119.1 hypothetical protein [Legionellales bacterium]HCA89457.1 hypothetical protein [Legionellales bacterium]